ncbi:MAG TPA: hypothetical protein VGM01_06465 [Ktedonobacteraceae bacterium]|jgi:hypothetical protein
MICQDCQQDVDEQEGSTYIFYYGTQSNNTPRSTRYKIKGSEKLFFCNNCVFTYAMQKRATIYRRWSIFFALVACAIALIAQFGSDGSTGAIPWLGVGLALAYAISLFAMGAVEKKRIENQDFTHFATAFRSLRGSNLAIALRKATWQEQGYNTFFTPQRLKKLNRIPSPTRKALPPKEA